MEGEKHDPLRSLFKIVWGNRCVKLLGWFMCNHKLLWKTKKCNFIPIQSQQELAEPSKRLHTFIFQQDRHFLTAVRVHKCPCIFFSLLFFFFKSFCTARYTEISILKSIKHYALLPWAIALHKNKQRNSSSPYLSFSRS